MAELGDLLERNARPDLTTVIDGFGSARSITALCRCLGCPARFWRSSLGVSSAWRWGDRIYEYGAGRFLIASVDLPVTGHFVDVTGGRPVLGLGMTLEPAAIAELLLQVGPADLPRSTGSARPAIPSAGRTGIQVSPYALGAMMFGAMGNPDHDDSIRIIHRALDAGINVVDTADVYSIGESEDIVGKALEGRRDDVVLACKLHYPMDDGPNHRGKS